MQDTLSNGTTWWGLVKHVVEDSRLLVKEELQLAKTELGEKASQFGRKAAPVAIGACLAYAGLIALLLGIGLLGAFALQQLGLQPLLAAAAGLSAAGMLLAAIGALVVHRNLKAFSKDALAPQNTMKTLKNLKALPAGIKPTPIQTETADSRTSQEIRQSVLATERRLTEALNELERRVTLTGIREQAKAELSSHPYRWGLIAMGSGMVGRLFLKGKVRPGFLKWSLLAARAILPLLRSKDQSRNRPPTSVEKLSPRM